MSAKQTFLEDLAQECITQFKDLRSLTIVFPNKRAGLFFQKALAEKAAKTIWLPEIQSLEEFVYAQSTLQLKDQLTLIFDLYKSFVKHQHSQEGFDKFFFWGEMLLKDFEDVDQSLADPNQLFQGIRSQKELDEFFYFLDEEDRIAIQSFWSSFLPESSSTQQQFLKTWQILRPVYHDFTGSLKKAGKGYQGMIYRDVVERCLSESVTWDRSLIFAGFNALTPAEESIIKFFVAKKEARVRWDCDAYYVDDPQQEAGAYFRQYRGDPTLGDTFTVLPNHLSSQPKELKITGVSLQVGQVKAAGDYINQLILDGNFKPEKTVLVLPQEHLLLPVLNSLPQGLDQVNVTMGYPLKETPLYTLLINLISLQKHLGVGRDLAANFYHKPVVEILSHPYVSQVDQKQSQSILARISKNNMIRVPIEELQPVNGSILALLFSPVQSAQEIPKHLIHIIRILYEAIQDQLTYEREYFFHFHKTLEQLDEILSLQETKIDVDILERLFNQVARALKIPFSGEPLQGLQVMGVLETRNLDFENVILLSMNEGSFPDSGRKGSFIPYNIRRAFNLPTFQQQDAIYAYLFYRLIQRADSVQMYYNTFSDFGLSGEVSRFVSQLEVESGLDISKSFISHPITVQVSKSIEIVKDDKVMKALAGYTSTGQRAFSPSAFSTYMTCRLQFYYRYIVRLFEQDEIQEQLDPAMFGNILHTAMERLYADIGKTKLPKVIDPNDYFLLKGGVDEAIRIAFKEYFHVKKGEKFEILGRNIIMNAVVRKYILKVLELDEAYAPFEIITLEGGTDQGYKVERAIHVNGEVVEVHLKGIIDRIDLKQEAMRIVDYKTGRDAREVKSLESLFDRENKDRNKAAFQLFYYAMLAMAKHGDQLKLEPFLYNLREMFKEEFDGRLYWKGGGAIEDMRSYIPLFETNLDSLLKEIFDQNVSFDQTSDLKTCQYCPYRNICQR